MNPLNYMRLHDYSSRNSRQHWINASNGKISFSVMDGNRITMSWKVPTVMKNWSRIQDGDARRIRSGWWMPTSDMLKSSNTNKAVAWLTLKSASYGELKRRSWLLSIRSKEGKPFIPV